MNFQSVKASPGKYVQLQAVITEIKHMDGDYGPYALGKAQDNQGVVEGVLFTIKKGAQFPTGLVAGHSCNWAGKFDANTGNMKLFFGSMAQRDVAAQAPQQAPPQAQEPYHEPVGQPQSPTPPPQAPMAPQGSRDATGTSIERQCAWKSACGVAASNRMLELKHVVDWAVRGAKFMADGMGDIPSEPLTQPSGPNPNYVGDNPPPPTDDDIPF